MHCWGSVGYLVSDLGVDRVERLPTQVDAEGRWSAVASGHGHLCGIRDGQMLCVGNNEHSFVGDGTRTARGSLTPVSERDDWTHVSSYDEHTCGIAGGELHCWGGQPLGNGRRAGTMFGLGETFSPDPIAVPVP